MAVNNVIIYLLIILVATVAILVILLTHCNREKTRLQKHDNKEKFCGACQGIGRKVCTNRPLLHKLYNEGILTEFSDYPKDPQWQEMSWDRFLANESTQPSLGTY